ncbi:hypothetical protein ScPMuIL_008552 [Solemya velum]
MEHQKRIDWSKMKQPYIPGEHHTGHHSEHHDHQQPHPEDNIEVIAVEMPHVKTGYHQDMDEIQDQLWASELQGTWVGSSPTDELDKIDGHEMSDTDQETKEIIDTGRGYLADEEENSANDKERMNPETQFQRSRTGLRFPIGNTTSAFTRPTPDAEMKKIKVVLPKEDAAFSEPPSSRRESPESLFESDVATLGSTRQMMGSYKESTDDASSDTTLLSEKMRAERPHTAHVKFMAEDLQNAFDTALKNYQSFPGASDVSAETLYRNDGLVFEEDWQDRVIERHMLLRMKKELRMRSAAVRRTQLTSARMKNIEDKDRCKSSIGYVGVSKSEPSVQVLERVQMANKPSAVRHSTGQSLIRPKTAHAIMVKSERSSEKPYRYRLSQDKLQVQSSLSSRPSSASSTRSNPNSKKIFDPRKIDPRNPNAIKPVATKSIPNKCSRFILVTKPKDKSKYPLPSPLESQLLAERFPKLGSVVYKHNADTLSRSRAVSPVMDYAPYLYQWGVS